MQSARLDVEPRSGNAVLNQLTGYALGRGLGFQAMSVIVTVVLALAANTSFGGLPERALRRRRDVVVMRVPLPLKRD